MLLLLAALAHAGDLPTVSAWTESLGDPSKPLDDAVAARTDGEPLLLYWMGVQAAPLGVGPDLPGTLVANFEPSDPVGASVLRDFTFLAVADAEQTAALEQALGEWVTGQRTEQRGGGPYRVIDLALPDGRVGSLSIKSEEAAGAMADGRPAPSLWMYVGPAE